MKYIRITAFSLFFILIIMNNLIAKEEKDLHLLYISSYYDINLIQKKIKDAKMDNKGFQIHFEQIADTSKILKSLDSLDFDYSKITKISFRYSNFKLPEKFKNCLNLKLLYIMASNIRNLHYLKNASEVEIFNSFNEKRIPKIMLKSLLEFNNLKRFVFKDYEMKYYPTSYINSIKLEELTIITACNKFPSDVCRFKNLTYLDVQGKFQKIDECIFLNENLEHFNYSIKYYKGLEEYHKMLIDKYPKFGIYLHTIMPDNTK